MSKNRYSVEFKILAQVHILVEADSSDQAEVLAEKKFRSMPPEEYFKVYPDQVDKHLVGATLLKDGETMAFYNPQNRE
jgi:hypothetical protein